MRIRADRVSARDQYVVNHRNSSAEESLHPWPALEEPGKSGNALLAYLCLFTGTVGVTRFFPSRPLGPPPLGTQSHAKLAISTPSFMSTRLFAARGLPALGGHWAVSGTDRLSKLPST